MSESDNTFGNRFAARLVSLIERRAGTIVLVGLAVSVIAVWLASQLRVDQDLKILLPPDAPALERLDALESRMGNLSDLIVAIRSPSREANLRYGEAIQARLAARDDIRFSLFHQDRAFFETNALLFLSIHDLLDLRERVIKRIKKEVAAAFNEGFEDDDAAPAPVGKDKDDFDLSEEELRERYGVDKQLPEYFEADEGRLIVVKARPKKGTTDVSFTKALLKGVQADIAALEPTSFHPEMTVTIEGSYATRSKDVRTVAGDSQRGTLAAFVLLLFCLGIYFRKIRAVPIVMVPLLMSIVVALGYAELRYGYLNLVSAFIFAVLLGLGIDFGIHILGRYEAERYRGHDRPEAMRITIASTGMSTMTGAASTIGVYLVLMTADFQGFAQFGELAAVGIIAAAICVLTVVPAFITLIERRRPWKPGRGKQVQDVPPPPRVRPPGRWAVYAALVLAVGGGWAAFAAAHVPDIQFEYDFRKLGPVADEKAEEDAKTQVTYKDAIGKENTFGPVVALTRDLAETEWVHRLLSDAKGLTRDQAEHFGAVRRGEYVAPPKAAEAPPAATAPATPASDDGDDDDEDEDVEEDDPVFAKLAAEAAQEGRLTPEALARFSAYSDERVRVMNRSLVQVLSVFSFVPERQEDKLVVIRDIRRRIDAKRAKLTADTKKKLVDVDKYLVVDAPIGVDDLPDWVKVQFRDDQGELGRFVIFRNHGSKDDYLVAKEIHETFFDLPGPSGPVPSAGNVYIMPELLDSVAADAPTVIGLALAVVVLTAFALFRTLAGAGAVTLTIVLAVLWLIGVMEVLDWKANFFNIITIPLLLGMGQDYAVHFYHRYTHDGVGRMRRVLRETGGAVFMTTLTTVIGFSGILFANHRGLLSLAWSSVIGVTFAFIASVAILPALIILSTWLAQRFGRGAPEGG
ncbi:MAG: MMPL family transporter [Deltaproteobacteria bacterium]|nr:MMPL family transporter [Deltaproteobacteria bacterium]